MKPEKLREWFDKVKKAGYAGDYDLWIQERRKAQTDLFWFAKYVLAYDLADNFYCPTHPEQMSDVSGTCSLCEQQMAPYPGGLPEGHSPHRQICDSFVHKNPDMSIPSQSTVKMRLLMFPRGSFKSSMDEADTIQWIICFPNVRIGLLTASENLGQQFVTKIKSFFRVVENLDGEKTYTRFQLLFPEHCVPAKKKEPEDRFITPARTKTLAEPTLLAISLNANNSGLHFDVGKFDDCVSNVNSGPGSTVEQRITVRRNIELAGSLVDPFGYIELIGTPYAEDDAYAWFIENKDPSTIYFSRKPAWQVKESSRRKKENELVESDYQLLFPLDGKGFPRLTYGFLRGKQSDPYNFACQYLCKPAAASQVKFTDQMFRAVIIPPDQFPQAGTYDIVAVWDCAVTDGTGSDFSVGSVGYPVIAGPQAGRLFVPDIVRGRFSKYELPVQIAKQAFRWKVSKIIIEKSPGVDFMETDLINSLRQAGFFELPTIEWLPVDSSKGAKAARIEQVERPLVDKVIWFSSEIECMNDVIKEFVNFKPGTKRKDDAADSVALLVRQIPTHIEIPHTEKQQQEAVREIYIRKQMLERLYPQQPEPVQIPEPPPTHWEGVPIIQSWEQQVYGNDLPK